MASATLKFDEKELEIGEEAMTFGRTPDNDVSFTDNSNISRNHAKIEFRDGKFRLTDLGSSNGTTVNGQKIEAETELNNGDFVTLGNSVVIEFLTESEESENEDEESNESQTTASVTTGDAAVKSAKFPVLLAVTGAICGLAVVFAVAAAYVGLSGGENSECNASARINGVFNGQTLSKETEVKIEITNGDCVKKVHLVLNGKPLATLEEEPYTAKINPDNFPELADGGLYNLQVLLEDAKGNQIGLPREVALQFDTQEIVTKTPDDIAKITPTPIPTQQGKQISIIETQKMTVAVVNKFTGASVKYNISNPEFLKAVQQKTAEYTSAPGYSQRAANFKTIIDQSFVREKGIDRSLAYILAMSRSKFNLEKQTGEGLWQISPEFANANSYSVVCTTFNLSDPTQECSAKVASIYLSELLPIFDGDIVYTVAAFGKSTKDASIWRDTLGADRSDFWKVITDQNQRELVVRFFAAAIVAENPPRFKMKNDFPISQLYPPVNAK